MKSISVTKIEITKEQLVINNPVVKFAKFAGHTSIADGKVDDALTGISTEKYEARKVVTSMGEIKYYLVKVGEESLFNELLSISDSDIERLKLNSYKEGIEMGKFRGAIEERKRYLSLPWYKKLLYN